MPDSIMKTLKDKEIDYVDLRFTDLRGKWHHTTQHVSTIDASFFEEGVMFDGSSIAGWKDIHESDMILHPDPATAFVDPFTAQNTLVLVCSIKDPAHGDLYNRDPRSIATRAGDYMRSTGIADTAYFGPEAEFFVFDDVRFAVESHRIVAQIDSEEGPYNSARSYDEGNFGHRPRPKGGYLPVPPVDSAFDLRSEMATTIKSCGVSVEKHHHEVAPSQHEIGIRFNRLLTIADHMQIYKYCVQMVAHSYGKTATFMPKPVFGDNGSGMHVHQSLWKGDKNIFLGDGYADLSETALHYIGGILKHARVLNAFANPTTNSYKRLVAGFEAPVLLAYSASNRSAACRIPTSPKEARRVEIRFPDPAANVYLTFAAMLMAGLDGIENKIHPGEPRDQDLYSLGAEELSKIPNVCGSLRRALDSLDGDRSFLTKGGVFDDDMIDAYIGLKREELVQYQSMPHPIEFQMYYSV